MNMWITTNTLDESMWTTDTTFGDITFMYTVTNCQAK
jgi:hypothetical protein